MLRKYKKFDIARINGSSGFYLSIYLLGLTAKCFARNFLNYQLHFDILNVMQFETYRIKLFSSFILHYIVLKFIVLNLIRDICFL